MRRPSLPQAEPRRWGLGHPGPWREPCPSRLLLTACRPRRTWVSLRLPNAPTPSSLPPLLGGPQTHPGRPPPSYWAALDGVGSLILPGNDDGGALQAATGPPLSRHTGHGVRPAPHPVVPVGFPGGCMGQKADLGQATPQGPTGSEALAQPRERKASCSHTERSPQNRDPGLGRQRPGPAHRARPGAALPLRRGPGRRGGARAPDRPASPQALWPSLWTKWEHTGVPPPRSCPGRAPRPLHPRAEAHLGPYGHLTGQCWTSPLGSNTVW